MKDTLDTLIAQIDAYRAARYETPVVPMSHALVLSTMRSRSPTSARAASSPARRTALI